MSGLRRRWHVADTAMKVGAELGLHGLEASRDKMNGWHPGAIELRQARYAGAAAVMAA
jgi:hypothetical protein